MFEKGLHAVFNGEAATDFRRRLMKEQGEISICKLCSSYGLPRLGHPKAPGFTAQWHSVNRSDIPSHAEALADAADRRL